MTMENQPFEDIYLSLKRLGCSCLVMLGFRGVKLMVFLSPPTQKREHKSSLGEFIALKSSRRPPLQLRKQ